jgi:hypothetical protein
LYAAGSARFAPHDLAKLCLVVLNKGMYRKKRIVPQKYILKNLDGVVETNWTCNDRISGYAPLKERYA